MIKLLQDMNNYRIVRNIADGGMGSVYEAIQDGARGFQKVVAVKTLLPELSEKDKFVDMFINEAKLVANLVHENIVQIYQLGHTPDGYYIVMEYVSGLTLDAFINHHTLTKKPIPRPLAVFIASRVARGLSYAHSRLDDLGRHMKIVHRDVCPKNVMITTEGLPKLTDFGIALVTANLAKDSPRSLMGKLSYMSPEQAAKEPVDFRTDIFALGAVLFELLSMRRIRTGETKEAMVELAKAGQIEWERLPDDTDADLHDILGHCLARDPDDRFASSAELARRLEYFIYKDGYGPTIQTLEEYMRSQFSELYQHGGGHLLAMEEEVAPGDAAKTDDDDDIAETLVMD